MSRFTRRATTTLLGLTMSALLLACGTSAGDAASGSESSTTHEPTAESDAPPPRGQGAELATLGAEGTRFDPPRSASDMPTGAWICDMGGSVHFAAAQEGEGRCPVCGMVLTRVGAGSGDQSMHGGH